MAKQSRTGNRRQIAQVYRHNGNTNEHGMPTLEVASDWSRITISGIPCEHIQTRGGDTVRGKQVTTQTSHVLIADYYAARLISEKDRIKINGVEIDVIDWRDPDGLQRDAWIECKREV